MYPYLHLGSTQLGTFGIFMWLSAVVGAWLLHRNFVRNGIEGDSLVIVATAMLAGMVGAKLWHELQEPARLAEQMHLIAEPGWSHPWQVLANFLTWFRAGFAWYGGLLFGLLALLWQGKSTRVGPIRLLDLAAPAAAVAYGVGRIGCLLAGDGDYGIDTTHPWGVHIREDALDPPHPNPLGLRVEPTPVYELALGIVIGFYLWVRGRKKLPIGQLTGEYLILSGIARFLIEFIRRNERLYFGLTNAQVASLCTILAGGAFVAISRLRATPSMATETDLRAPEIS